MEATYDLYGPALPPGFKTGGELNEVVNDDQKSTENMKIAKRDRSVIGPQLPPGFTKRQSSDSSEEEEDEEEVEVDEDGDIIGPLPYTGEDMSLSKLKNEFDNRAMKMKKQLCGLVEKEKTEREEWMTTPPTQLTKAFGTGPRTFSQRAGPIDNDNSAWTSIAGKTVEKPKEKPKLAEDVFVDSRKDKKFTEVVETYKKSNKESLMDIHKKNLKRKNAENEPQDRRPFDRNVDLAINHVDDAQRDAIVKKSRLLNDRFSAGQSKFL